MVEVTEEEVKNSVKLIPSWTTVVRGRGGGSLVLEVCGYRLGLALLLPLREQWGIKSVSHSTGAVEALLYWSLMEQLDLVVAET